MRMIHRALMGGAIATGLVFAVGAIHPGHAVLAQHGNAQHGHDGAMQHEAASLEEHFHAMIEHLELTEAQHTTLAEPLHDAYAAMQELHRLHDVIAAELTEEQQKRLAEMVHSMMGSAGGGHGEASHRGPRH